MSIGVAADTRDSIKVRATHSFLLGNIVAMGAFSLKDRAPRNYLGNIKVEKSVKEKQVKRVSERIKITQHLCVLDVRLISKTFQRNEDHHIH